MMPYFVDKLSFLYSCVAKLILLKHASCVPLFSLLGPFLQSPDALPLPLPVSLGVSVNHLESVHNSITGNYLKKQECLKRVINSTMCSANTKLIIIVWIITFQPLLYCLSFLIQGLTVAQADLFLIEISCLSLLSGS